MSIRHPVRLFGLALSIAALVLVTWKTVGLARTELFNYLTPSFLLALGLVSASYTLLDSVIGFAWHNLLAGTGTVAMSRWQALTIWGRSQVLKYLPSNTLHYVGRHGAAYRAGASHGALVWSLVAETALVSMAAALVAALFARSLIAQRLSPVIDPSVPLPLLVVTAFGLAILALARPIRRRICGESAAAGSDLLAKSIATAFALYLFFFLANGLLLDTLVSTLPLTANISPWQLAGIFSFAWLAGFVVPGSPGGIGIREFVLTAGLEGAGLGPWALPIALAYRVVTLVGDLSIALISHAWSHAQS
jgi:hypothetical protein